MSYILFEITLYEFFSTKFEREKYQVSWEIVSLLLGFYVSTICFSYISARHGRAVTTARLIISN